MKRRERVLGLGLKKSGPNMGFESESESVRRSGGLKTDDIGKRDFHSDDSSIFLTRSSSCWALSWFLLLFLFPLYIYIFYKRKRSITSVFYASQ